MSDCGATESLGGIASLENAARLNAKKYGTSKMCIDRTDRPTNILRNGESVKVDQQKSSYLIKVSRQCKRCPDCGTKADFLECEFLWSLDVHPVLGGPQMVESPDS